MRVEIHVRELAVAQHDAHAAKQAVAELRRAEAERKARGRWARLSGGSSRQPLAVGTLLAGRRAIEAVPGIEPGACHQALGRARQDATICCQSPIRRTGRLLAPSLSA